MKKATDYPSSVMPCPLKDNSSKESWDAMKIKSLQEENNDLRNALKLAAEVYEMEVGRPLPSRVYRAILEAGMMLDV